MDGKAMAEKLIDADTTHPFYIPSIITEEGQI